MRQVSNQKRQRGGRSGGRKGGGSHTGNRTFESSGPSAKIRGSASQLFDKYQALARDATLSGDRISAENYLQHAEHYFRILSVGNDSGQHRGGNAGGNANREAQVQPQPQGPRERHGATPRPAENEAEAVDGETATPEPEAEPVTA